MANSQLEPWNNLWADLSQGMANSQMEPWNNLWDVLNKLQVISKPACFAEGKIPRIKSGETEQTLLTCDTE